MSVVILCETVGCDVMIVANDNLSGNVCKKITCDTWIIAYNGILRRS
jgi:hypothetical protein